MNKISALGSIRFLRPALLCLLLGASALAMAEPDADGDGIPDFIEPTLGLNAAQRDNDVFSSARLFAMQHYRDFYAREGTTSEINALTDKVAKNTASRDSVVMGWFGAPEYASIASSTIRLYRAYFDRLPDLGGLRFWINYGRTNSIDAISDYFSVSPEFQQRYGNKTDDEFVTLIYNNVFKRAPDPGGYAYWTGQLKTKARTRGNVMNAFAQSVEFQQSQSPETATVMAFAGLLNRLPDAAGGGFWMNYLKTGGTVAGMVGTIMGGPEYRARFVDDSIIRVSAATKEAARFLSQATFGFSRDELDRVSQMSYDAWIEEQIAQPWGNHVDYVRGWLQRAQTTDPKIKEPYEDAAYQALWQNFLFSNAQLRARVAFALSQIVVVSNIAPNIHPWALASYQDMLYRNAFGNYRTLLEEVTLHPAMGYFLDGLGNKKESLTPKMEPNENYGRELLQLFTLGLYELNPDGTRKLDAAGQPISSYTEEQVRGFARAFTGWSWSTSPSQAAPGDWPGDFPTGATSDAPWTTPMKAFPEWHSTGDKQLLGMTIPFHNPADTTAITRNLKTALDNVFAHPNVGPFVCKQLIQRLVTSNPSPAYVTRVVAKFNDNGAGVRGDLKAVVKAILLDTEARSATVANDAKFGKQREPVIRLTHLLRTFKATSKSGRNNLSEWVGSLDNGLAQAPLLAPSVFNFFSPFYTKSGAIAQNRLVAPEFQITNEITGIGQSRFFWERAGQRGIGWGDDEVKFDDTLLKTLSKQPLNLVNYLEPLFANGEVSKETRAAIVQALESHPDWDDWGRVRTALTLFLLSPDYAILR